MSTNAAIPCPLARSHRPGSSDPENRACCQTPRAGASDRADRRPGVYRPIRAARQDGILASRWMAENA